MELDGVRRMGFCQNPLDMIDIGIQKYIHIHIYILISEFLGAPNVETEPNWLTQSGCFSDFCKIDASETNEYGETEYDLCFLKRCICLGRFKCPHFKLLGIPYPHMSESLSNWRPKHFDT